MEICSPVLVYFIFSITQLFLDISNKMYNTAFMKLFVIIAISILLLILCDRGQTTIAWLIVFIPFIFMSVIIGMLLYMFGLNPTTGMVKLPPNVSQDNGGNIVVYDPNYDPINHPVYYKNPNIIIPYATYTQPIQPPPPPPEPYVAQNNTTSSPNENINETTIPIPTSSSPPPPTSSSPPPPTSSSPPPPTSSSSSSPPPPTSSSSSSPPPPSSSSSSSPPPPTSSSPPPPTSSSSSSSS